MTDLLASGQFVDLILVFMVLEGLCLLAYGRATGRGLAPSAVVTNLLSGGFLVLALRAALAGAPAAWIALCMAAAFMAHVADLQRRWRG